MIHDIPISAFPTALDTAPISTTLGSWLRSTKNIPAITAIRASQDPKERSALKKKLPAATISGTFHARNISGIDRYNGLVCLDFDADDNPESSADDMKSLLCGFSEIAYCAVSVSGRGVYAIMPTNLTDHTLHSRCVDMIGGLIEKNTGLRYDRSCKDVSRLRFISYDPDAWWPDQYGIFNATAVLQHIDQMAAARPSRPLIIPKSKTPKLYNSDKKVEQCLAIIDERRIDLTVNYDSWIHLGMALASEFGAAGEEYFHRVSQHSPKYSQQEAQKKYQNLLTTTSNVRIGTFFHLCQQAGIRHSK